MIKFSKDKVLLLHQLIAEETGGSIGVRDEGLLESALEAAFSTFGGQELYPTKEEKGARIGFNLISNHAFVGGGAGAEGCCGGRHIFRGVRAEDRTSCGRPCLCGAGRSGCCRVWEGNACCQTSGRSCRDCHTPHSIGASRRCRAIPASCPR